MGMYTRVCGWVNYLGADQKRAIQAAIAKAVEQAEDLEFAEAVAANWSFVDDGLGAYGGDYVFWGGHMRSWRADVIRAQVEAVADVLEVDNDWLPDGRPGYALRGLFDVEIEEGPRLEWRLYGKSALGKSVHENEREIPTWIKPGGWDTSRDAPIDPAV